MTIEASDPRELVLTLGNDALLQGGMAQLRAKSILTEILGESPSYNWTYVPARVVRNAVAMQVSLEALSLTVEELDEEVQLSARRFASAWEDLASLGEGGAARYIALLNGAAAYDFAGYQINSICLARLAAAEAPSEFVRIVARFQARQLMGVVHAERPAAHLERLAQGTSTEEVVYSGAVSLALAGVQEAARFMLSGDQDKLTRSAEQLEQAGRILLQLGAAEEAVLLQRIRSLLPVIKRRSIWTVLGRMNSTPRWRRYLMLLARGLSSDLLAGTSESELWPSQITAIEGGLLDANRGKIVRMPTSSGKTRIAEMALAQTLTNHPGVTCIYVAPYRSLVTEIESNLIAILGDLGFHVSTVLGGFETDELELFLAQRADVLVITPEKLDLLDRLSPEFVQQVGLVILDEGHVLGDSRRGVKYEILMTRLRRAAPDARFIFLSAVVPDQTLEDFASWLGTGPDSLMRTDWRPTGQRHAALRWSGTRGTLHYSTEQDAPILSSFVPNIVRQQIIEFVNPDTRRRNKRRFPESENKSQIAAELALKYSEFGSVLVFCPTPRLTTAVGLAILDRVNWTELAGLTDIPTPPTTMDTRSAQLAQEWLGQEHKVTKLLGRGIAVHYGQLPNVVKTAVENDFRAKRYKIIVATNTLAQGVNLPIRTVIIHSVWRGQEDNRHRIPARDYWNIAGRAGRAGEETEGTIIHIVRTPLDAHDYEFYRSRRQNIEPVESALLKLLRDVISNRLSSEAIRQELDADILSLVLEETDNDAIAARISDIMEGTLAFHQSTRLGVDPQPLKDLTISVAQQIVQEVPDQTIRRVFSTTGLSTQSCVAMTDYIDENRQKIEDLFLRGQGLPFEAALLVSDVAAGVTESEVQAAFGGSYSALLENWMNGASIPNLRDSLGDTAPDVEQLASFIEGYFGSRLPWIASGFIRIVIKKLDTPEEQFPVEIRMLPAMIKTGVSSVAAAWAAGAGVASRDAAMRVGSAYEAVLGAGRPQDTLGGSGSYGDFLEWVASLTSEDLIHRFGLRGAVLEETLTALQRNATNPFLADLSRSSSDTIEFSVRGIAYENRAQVAATAHVGSEVEIVRDYDNLADRNATAVYLGRRQLGYVPRDLAQLLAPDIDTGARFRGEITANDQERVPQVTVRLSRP